MTEGDETLVMDGAACLTEEGNQCSSFQSIGSGCLSTCTLLFPYNVPTYVLIHMVGLYWMTSLLLVLRSLCGGNWWLLCSLFL